MSNVIHAPFSTPASRKAAAIGPLLRGFATARRPMSDVMWLKENGELLNILESTGTEVPAALLDVHQASYADSAARLSFFPQYYRFILSIALDLEDLGLAGSGGHAQTEAMCDWILSQRLVEGETSDIQRLEAQRLLARRGRAAPGAEGAEERLRAFISDPARFALPNKKAAYELTHIVFYLSEYGRKDPHLGEMARKSLEYVGIWAFLDGNVDLLAEICIAMRYAGYNPNEIWELWIAKEMSTFHVSQEQKLRFNDDYHAAFMGAWLAMLRGDGGLAALEMAGDGQGAPVITSRRTKSGALRELSRHLYDLGARRSADWTTTRQSLDPTLSDEARGLVDAAEVSCSAFTEFFECFSRTARVGIA